MEERLLFIAPSVPHYDQNSGDLRLFSILEIVSKSYEITFLAQSTDPQKDDRYISCLKDMGLTVLVGNYPLIKILQKNKFKAAILEFYFVAEYYLPRIRIIQPVCPIIIDTVDVHYFRLYLKYQITKEMNDLRKAEETKRRELDIYKKADIVITVTEEDANLLLKDCPNLPIRSVPNIHRLILSKNTPDRNKLVFVGGFSHDPNVDAVLYFCKDVLPLIRNVIPDVKFTIVGSNPPEQIKALSNDFIIVTGYVPSTTPYLQESYISVAPLRYGAGMKGKIGEAMAHGLPVVTTSIGAQGMGLVNGKNSMIADSAENFAAAIIELIQNESLHKTIQKNALDYIGNNYTDVQVGKQLENILLEIGHLPIKKVSFLEGGFFFFKYPLNLVKKKLNIAFSK